MQRLYAVMAVIILLLAWAGPLPSMAPQSFAGHMTMHMLVVGIAAPLLALALSTTRFDPSERHPHLFGAIPSAVGELVVVWGWHAPMLHHFARHENFGLFLEQGSFILVGVWVWLSCFSPTRRGAGIIGLLLTSMHMTLLGALLALAPRPLYTHHHRATSMTSLEDQQLGGAIMLVVGAVVYLWGGVMLTFKMIREKKITFSSGRPS